MFHGGRSIAMVIYSLGGFSNLGALHAVSVIINFMIGSPQKDWTVIANKFGRILRSYLSVAVSTWWSGDSLYINGVPPRLMGVMILHAPNVYIYIHIHIVTVRYVKKIFWFRTSSKFTHHVTFNPHSKHHHVWPCFLPVTLRFLSRAERFGATMWRMSWYHDWLGLCICTPISNTYPILF